MHGTNTRSQAHAIGQQGPSRTAVFERLAAAFAWRGARMAAVSQPKNVVALHLHDFNALEPFHATKTKRMTCAEEGNLHVLACGGLACVCVCVCVCHTCLQAIETFNAS